MSCFGRSTQRSPRPAQAWTRLPRSRVMADVTTVRRRITARRAPHANGEAGALAPRIPVLRQRLTFFNVEVIYRCQGHSAAGRVPRAGIDRRHVPGARSARWPAGSRRRRRWRSKKRSSTQASRWRVPARTLHCRRLQRPLLRLAGILALGQASCTYRTAMLRGGCRFESDGGPPRGPPAPAGQPASVRRRWQRTVCVPRTPSVSPLQ